MHMILALAATMAAAQLPALAATYRFEDETGQINYSDRLPPEQSNRSRSVLDARGLTRQRVDPAGALAERERAAELDRLRKRVIAVVRAQRQDDVTLLRTFRSEADVDRVADNRMEIVDADVHRIERSIERLRALRNDQETKAAADEREGRGVSNTLRDEITALIRQIEQLTAQTFEKQRAREAIQADAAMQRARLAQLREIYGQKDRAGGADLAWGAAIEITECADIGACDTLWNQARAFVLTQNLPPVDLNGSVVLMTQRPVDDDGLGVILARLNAEEGESGQIMLDVRCRDTHAGRKYCDRAVDPFLARYRDALNTH